MASSMSTEQASPEASRTHVLVTNYRPAEMLKGRRGAPQKGADAEMVSSFKCLLQESTSSAILL
jgi:hypothetical protein